MTQHASSTDAQLFCRRSVRRVSPRHSAQGAASVQPPGQRRQLDLGVVHALRRLQQQARVQLVPGGELCLVAHGQVHLAVHDAPDQLRMEQCKCLCAAPCRELAAVQMPLVVLNSIEQSGLHDAPSLPSGRCGRHAAR